MCGRSLSDTDQPTVLSIRAYEGVGGYDYIAVRRAACEAGVRHIDFAGDLPAGSFDAAAAPAQMRGAEDVQLPCVPVVQEPDTSAFAT